MSFQDRQQFWREAASLQGSIIPHVLPRVFVFGVIASVICVIVWLIETWLGWQFTLTVTPHELGGAVLGVLLVLRTNSGYERWWEARKLWGGIVDRSRNLTISALCYGPKDSTWRSNFVHWIAAYPHVVYLTLRGEAPSPHVTRLVGSENAASLATADHMPSFVSMQLGEMLEQANEEAKIDRMAFMQVDRERVLLIDNFGGCERILNTPLPKAYSLKIRQFILLYLVTLPFALLHRMQAEWLVPLIVMAIAYPIVSLDQLGVELENPFWKSRLSHLPLESIAATIERNVLALLKEKESTET